MKGVPRQPVIVITESRSGRLRRELALLRKPPPLVGESGEFEGGCAGGLVDLSLDFRWLAFTAR